MSSKSNYVGVRVDKEIDDALILIAANEGIRKSEVIRQILKDGVSENCAKEGLDVITDVLSNTINARLANTENRLAKLTAKACKDTAITKYLTIQFLSDIQDLIRELLYQMAQKGQISKVDLPLYNFQEMHKEAEVKAIKSMRNTKKEIKQFIDELIEEDVIYKEKNKKEEKD